MEVTLRCGPTETKEFAAEYVMSIHNTFGSTTN